MPSNANVEDDMEHDWTEEGCEDKSYYMWCRRCKWQVYEFVDELLSCPAEDVKVKSLGPGRPAKVHRVKKRVQHGGGNS